MCVCVGGGGREGGREGRREEGGGRGEGGGREREGGRIVIIGEASVCREGINIIPSV